MVRLNNEESLVVEEAVREGTAGRVAVLRGEKVGNGGGSEVRALGVQAHEDIVEESREERGGGELVG